MNKISRLFLQALKASLQSEKILWDQEVSEEEWKTLFFLSQKHQVLPIIYEAVYSCPDVQNLPPETQQLWKRQVIRTVMIQGMKTDEFVRLYRRLDEHGIHPKVVKGIICRKLYPNPDHRVSGDEDILIRENTFSEFHKAMLECGMELAAPEQNLAEQYEVTYRKQKSPIVIEAHKTLFPSQSDAYGELNRYFEGVWEHENVITILNTQIHTLDPTDNLFYLICHAFKHFLHSGFGIRQVCDIILFANAYGTEIRWDKILQQCREIHAEKFAAALFKIGENYLVFDPQKAAYPQEWRNMETDEIPLLLDLLEGGLFGDASMSRKHSSNITLHAVSAEKHGKKTSFSLLKTVFPSAEDLKKRYGYLQKHPYLLPAAWIQRMAEYRKETRKTKNDQAVEAVRIGSRRLELLKYYGILNH